MLSSPPSNPPSGTPSSPSSPLPPSNMSACAYPPFDDAHRAKPCRRAGKMAERSTQTQTTMQTKQQASEPSAHSTIVEPTTSQVLQFARPASSSSSSLSTPPINAPIPLHTDFDLVYELENNWERYKAHTSDGLVICIKNYPIMISESIRTLCRFVTRYPAGITIGSSACIAGGLSTIMSHENVQTLLGLRERFTTIRDLSGDCQVRTIIAEVFRSFNLELPHDQERYNLTVPLTMGTFNELAKLADELGITNPDLAKVCMMITLCGQGEVLSDWRKHMTRFIDVFWHRAWVRAEATRAMLDRFGL